jgi:hypothetical protein
MSTQFSCSVDDLVLLCVLRQLLVTVLTYSLIEY